MSPYRGVIGVRDIDTGAVLRQTGDTILHSLTMHHPAYRHCPILKEMVGWATPLLFTTTLLQQAIK